MHRIAWTVADLHGVQVPGLEELDVALRLRYGRAADAEQPQPGAIEMNSEDERLARAALSRLTEPGEPRLGALVSELGAVRLHRMLAEERDLAGLRTDVAARLTGLDPRPNSRPLRARVFGS